MKGAARYNVPEIVGKSQNRIALSRFIIEGSLTLGCFRGKRFRGRGVDGTADRAWIGDKKE